MSLNFFLPSNLNPSIPLSSIISSSSNLDDYIITNILTDNPKSVWLSNENLPQYIIINLNKNFFKIFPKKISAIGIKCWHGLETNPKLIEILISNNNDNNKNNNNNFNSLGNFELIQKPGIQVCQFDEEINFNEEENEIKIKIIIKETFGQNRTYLNNIYIYENYFDENNNENNIKIDEKDDIYLRESKERNLPRSNFSTIKELNSTSGYKNSNNTNTNNNANNNNTGSGNTYSNNKILKNESKFSDINNYLISDSELSDKKIFLNNNNNHNNTMNFTNTNNDLNNLISTNNNVIITDNLNNNNNDINNNNNNIIDNNDIEDNVNLKTPDKIIEEESEKEETSNKKNSGKIFNNNNNNNNNKTNNYIYDSNVKDMISDLKTDYNLFKKLEEEKFNVVYGKIHSFEKEINEIKNHLLTIEDNLKNFVEAHNEQNKALYNSLYDSLMNDCKTYIENKINNIFEGINNENYNNEKNDNSNNNIENDNNEIINNNNINNNDNNENDERLDTNSNYNNEDYLLMEDIENKNLQYNNNNNINDKYYFHNNKFNKKSYTKYNNFPSKNNYEKEINYNNNSYNRYNNNENNFTSISEFERKIDTQIEEKFINFSNRLGKKISDTLLKPSIFQLEQFMKNNLDDVYNCLKEVEKTNNKNVNFNKYNSSYNNNNKNKYSYNNYNKNNRSNI